MSESENKDDASGLIDFAEVRQRVSLKGFVESCGVSLRQEGNRNLFRGKCPLHNEKNGASLIIYPDDRWHCHGKCARGGDVVDFARAYWGETDLEETVNKLLAGGPIPRSDSQGHVAPTRISEPKWPARDLGKIRQVVSWATRGLSLSYLQKNSPFRFVPGRDGTEQVIDIIFPGNPLLCCGWTPFKFHTWSRELWRGRLSGLQFIVPNPMVEPVGLTQSGKWSEHAQSSTGRRVYLAIEYDFSEFERDQVTPTVWAPLIAEWKAAGITVADACSALHLHLAEELALVMVVSSGGRSVHGWYYVFDRTSDEGIWPFMRHAYSIGADHVTWNRAQFVRMPQGLRANGNRQSLIYLDPGKAVKDA